MGVCDHMTTSPDDSATVNMPKASMAVTKEGGGKKNVSSPYHVALPPILGGERSSLAIFVISSWPLSPAVSILIAPIADP